MGEPQRIPKGKIQWETSNGEWGTSKWKNRVSKKNYGGRIPKGHFQREFPMEQFQRTTSNRIIPKRNIDTYKKAGL